MKVFQNRQPPDMMELQMDDFPGSGLQAFVR